MKLFMVRLGTLLAASSLAALQQGCAPAPAQQAPVNAAAASPDVVRTAAALKAATPFQNSNGLMPPPGSYSGPFFSLSHDWPTRPIPPLVNAPWQAAIGNGRITVRNAPAYAAALRAAVARNARALIMDRTWNAGAAGWYNEPWVGSQREAIRGTYPAGDFTPAIFPNTGLRAEFTTNVLTYYDARAAQTLRQVWGATAMTPNLTRGSTQFAEGSIIVKAALFTSANPAMPTNWWDAMAGAQVWQLFIPVGPQGGQDTPPQVWPGYVAQFDIIVKDSQSSPETGWVFMTLVYDNRVRGDAWDRMIPLGVQWGNDPQANRAGMPLRENWINPRAPLYSTQTLGFGGRLSGPNDGARNDIAVGGSPTRNGTVMRNAPDSSCMSCHSTAQWDRAAHVQGPFLLPSYPNSFPSTPTSPPFLPCADTNGRPNADGALICSPAPGSAAWMVWFQNRPGTGAMIPGASTVATDFDLVLSFKSLPLWWAAVGPQASRLPMLTRVPGTAAPRHNLYNGAPLPRR